MLAATPPVALFIGGHDPSGGAGLVADIQTASQLGVHPLTLVSALTDQDTENVFEMRPVDPQFLETAFARILADCPPACLKIGLIGSPALIETLARLLAEHPDLPVVFDPVLRASGGFEFGRIPEWVEAIRSSLLRHITLLTPNLAELAALAPDAATPEAAARALQDLGTRAILVTGADHEPGSPEVMASLYRDSAPPKIWRDLRLPGAFHGSGCTLAAAITSLLARGFPLERAIGTALHWTHVSLLHARALGRGGQIPFRLSLFR
jgi:hydroxymethylpyrimidine/phosphomethylpyrimidine kinase